MKKSGKVTSTINPPPGAKYTQCCAGEVASYFLRDDGAVDRSVSLPCVHQFLLNPTCSYTLHTYGCSRLYDDYITILQLPLLPLFSSLLSSFFSSSLRSSHRSRPSRAPPPVPFRARPPLLQVKNGLISETINADGSTYIAISEGFFVNSDENRSSPQARYLVRADGQVDRTWSKVPRYMYSVPAFTLVLVLVL